MSYSCWALSCLGNAWRPVGMNWGGMGDGGLPVPRGGPKARGALPVQSWPHQLPRPGHRAHACGCLHACMRVHSVCTCVSLCVCACLHGLCVWGMGAVCRWGSSAPSPRHKSPQTLWGQKTLTVWFCLVSLTEFWGTVEQRLGPRACVPSATCGADALGPVRTLTDEQGGV